MLICFLHVQSLQWQYVLTLLFLLLFLCRCCSDTFFCAWLMRMSGEICVLTMRFGKAFSRMHLDQRFSELRR